MKLRYHIKTYGCQMNYSDTERVMTVLEKMGYEPVDHYNDADLVILNTCMGKKSAENGVYGLGEPFKKLKVVRWKGGGYMSDMHLYAILVT